VGEEEGKMTPEERQQYIDDKLKAVAESLESLTLDVHSMQDRQVAFLEQQRRFAEREERLRSALLAGIAGFLRELGGAGNGMA
jgi:hypothetical protein